MDIAYEAPYPPRVTVAVLIEQGKGILILGQRFHVVDALWRNDERLALFLIGFGPVEAIIVDNRPICELFRGHGPGLPQTLGEHVIFSGQTVFVPRAREYNDNPVAAVRERLFNGNGIADAAVKVQIISDGIGPVDHGDTAGSLDWRVVILTKIVLGEVDRLAGFGVGGNDDQSLWGGGERRIVQLFVTSDF